MKAFSGEQPVASGWLRSLRAAFFSPKPGDTPLITGLINPETNNGIKMKTIDAGTGVTADLISARGRLIRRV
jgi:hypothetical protein